MERIRRWKLDYFCRNGEFCDLRFCGGPPRVHPGSTGGPPRVHRGSPGGPTGKHVTPYTPIPGRFQQIRRRRVGNRFAQLLVPPFIFCDFLDFDGIWPEPRKNDRSNKVSTRCAGFCTAPSSKIQLNFVKHFRIFTVLFSNVCLFFASLIQNSEFLIC